MSVWEEVTDDQGRTYYYNPLTQETSWTKPDESTRESKWQAYTADNGKQYYYNESTGETTWEIPSELKENESGEEEANKEIVSEASRESNERPKTGDQIDMELESKSLKSNELVNPPQFGSFSEAEEAFVNLLKENGVDSTWSFQSVMSKFIKNPIYWAIPDSLHRKMLYDEYLVSKFKEELSNKTQVIENFEKNFTEVLENYEKQGKIKYNTRWISVKKILISEENPIFKHSVLLDNEIAEIYRNFTSGLKKAHDDSIKSQKQQALIELESYLTQVNPSLVSESGNWEQLYDNLLKDSRFKANKHFNILNKLDILELYQDKIYSNTLNNLKEEIKQVEKKNYRSDRKARQSFKEFLKAVKINANTLFKDIYPILENEDSFIELCGRNGSSPLEFFWDIVDEKNQSLKLKKDLVESVLLDLRKSDSSRYNYDKLLSSKENFIGILANMKDERLSTLEVKISNETQDENEVEIIYDNLKRDFDLSKERRKISFQKELSHAVQDLANWLYFNYDKYNLVNIVNDAEEVKSDYINLSVAKRSDGSKFYTVKGKGDNIKLKEKLNSAEDYQKLNKLILRYYEDSNDKIDKTLNDSIDDLVREFVKVLNYKSSRSSNERKRVRESTEIEKSSIKKHKTEDLSASGHPAASRVNTIRLNY